MINDNLFKKGETIAVALSGGKDSVALLYSLLSVKDKLGIFVKAVNVEHGIRGEASKKDSLFVADLCKRLSVPLKTYYLDCIKFSEENGYGIEEGARIARYDCFNSAIEEGFCDKIATAHHLSDSVETLLFNLFRGASLSGATGIKTERNNGKIIRPFADTPKSEIEKYVADNGLNFVEDETNRENVYSRNYIRNEIMPVVSARFPEAEKSIGRFLKITESENDFLEELAKKSLTRDGNAYFIPIDTPDCLSARAAVLAMKSLGIGKDYVKLHVDAVLSLKDLANGSKVSLPRNVYAAREYDKIAIYKTVEKDMNFERPFALGYIDGVDGELTFDEIKAKEKTVNAVKRNGSLVFDLNKLPKNAVVRYRRPGDYFKKFGGNRKKLNDYFIDKKIPLRLRDSIPLVCAGSEVYIICGTEISDVIKVDKGTEKVVQCTYLPLSVDN